MFSTQRVPVASTAVLLFALGLGACTAATLNTAARDKLVKETGCPADQVKVEELPDSKYRVTGCQKTATYVCRAAEHAVVSCVPEALVQ
jgi:uncharacterized OsmC-like protein